MFRDAAFILRKDLKYMLREKETILWVFVMPIVFFGIIGTITGGFGSGTSDSPDPLAVEVGDNGGFLVEQLFRRLEDRNYAIVRPETEEELARYSRRLSIPANFTDTVLAGEPVQIDFDQSREGIALDYENVRVSRAVYTVLADLVVTGLTDEGPSVESFARINEMPRALTLDVRPAGKRREVPTGFEQSVPGIMVMFTLLVLTTSGATLLVIERRQGLLRRLASTPIDRRSVVLGKWGGKMLLGFVQIGFAMLVGTFPPFRMNWGPDLGMVVLVMMAYAAVMASFGIVLGSLARTEGQAIGIGVFSANVLAALGGCWWPIEVTSEWMQRLQLFLPTGWAMNALHRLVSFAAGPGSVLPHLIAMTLTAALLLWVATRVFRYE